MKENVKTGNFASAVVVALILFVAIVSLGTSLAILPIYVNKVLGLSPYFVGAVVTAESVSTLLSRAYAGRFSDTRGPKTGMIRGLLLMFVAGALCVAALATHGASAYLSFAVVFGSRVLMGVGESLIFTCSGTWPIGLVGREHAGKIMSWVGIAMFLGLAIGNYAGVWSYQHVGLVAGAAAMTGLPLLGTVVVWFIKEVSVHDDAGHLPLSYAVKRVWKAGAGFALANVGYASVTSFLALLFLDNGWNGYAALALALFGIGYVAARLLLGWRADSSGVNTIVVSLAIEAAGLLCLAYAGTPLYASIGSFLAGFGLSMVYPLLALPAIKSLPEKNIGLALSTYESCFDIGILLAGAAGGIIASHVGYASIFVFAFVCSLLAIVCSYFAYQQLFSEVGRAAT
ncbi:major Facilitator Superfamily protein [Burkholderia thailandensis MSMB121]|nr:major Facilitator Superfamily protein [Burkholderia thailandensis MSMB121]ATF36869.1 MFS transporter [Burkholderia thailandensis]KST74245.1 MFS transporter [Burkholderia humptydooensis]